MSFISDYWIAVKPPRKTAAFAFAADFMLCSVCRSIAAVNIIAAFCIAAVLLGAHRLVNFLVK